jgi:anti-sigma-K factor RskA
MFFVIFGPKPGRDWRFGAPSEASDVASGIWRLLLAAAIVAVVVTLLELAGTGGKRDDPVIATSPDTSSHVVGEEFQK